MMVARPQSLETPLKPGRMMTPAVPLSDVPNSLAGPRSRSPDDLARSQGLAAQRFESRRLVGAPERKPRPCL